MYNTLNSLWLELRGLRDNVMQNDNMLAFIENVEVSRKTERNVKMLDYENE